MSKEFLLKLGAAALVTAFAFSTANAGESNAGSSSSASASGGSFASASVSDCGCGDKPHDGGKPRDVAERPAAVGGGTACAVKDYSSRKYMWVTSSSSECGCTWRKNGDVTKWMCPVRISSAKRK